jgi:hypothetical protein
MNKIVGAGGGGGGGKGGGGGGSEQRTPTEAGDNLNSTQYASVLDLISEGEIQGLKNGLQSIYLNNTPVQNPDGSLNFQNLIVQVRNGTQAQIYIPGTDLIEDEKPVGIQVQQATPIIRTITDANVDAARVSITVPQLQRFTDQGDIVGSVFRLQIAVQYNGGGYTTVIDDTIAGRSADQYQRDYLVNFAGAKPVDIRVTRITGDSSEQDVGGSSGKIINAFNWSSYTEITYAKLRYPNSALIGLRIDAEQFSSIPSRSYLIRGIKLRIPNNATVDATTGRLIYSGVWTGTFGAAQWCSDPAWILWDLLTSTRYGFGDHIQAAQLDKWAFYAASQYASELVPDGFGSTEPRFSCNVNIQTAEEAYKLINDLCSTFRAMPYWSTGALTISQDKPSDAAYLFTLANVSEEGFSYQGGSLKTRPTVAVVSYLDLSLRDIAYEVVEDQTAIAKYGVVTTEVSAFACTSRGQASRIGEWLLYSEQYESEVVTFTASIDAGVLVRPGQVINIADPMRSGARRGGRITAATTTTITVDNAIDLSPSGGTLSVILSDGTVQSRGVASIAGTTVTLASALPSAPNANSIWIYETSNIQASTWRVLSVTEQDQAQYQITALAYNESKYDYIERGRPLAQRDITDLNVIPEAPINLQAVEALYESNGRVLSKLVVSWQPVVGVNQYRYRWRLQNGNWTISTQQRPDFEIFDTTPGGYAIEVYSVNAALRTSVLPAKLTLNVFGKTAPPAGVTGVSLVPIDQASAIISWTASTELDVKIGGKVLIRHTPLLIGAIWENSIEIVPAASGNQTQKQVPLLEGTYLLKFEDDGGRRSPNATLIVADLPTPLPRLLVQTYAEDQETPPFSGNVTDMFYNEELDGLVISTGPLVDDLAPIGAAEVEPLLLEESPFNDLYTLGYGEAASGSGAGWDGLTTIDSPLPPEYGEYEFGSTLDMGGVFDINLQRRFLTRAILLTGLWDEKVELIDSWSEIDEGNIDSVNARLYVRSTPDNPAGTPTWSTWREFANAIVRGRGFQFKTIATSNDPNANILIDELGCVVELQQRTEQSATLTSGTGTYSVTFAEAFYQPPSIGVTGYDMGTADYFTIGSVTRTGLQVTFRNSGGTAVSRQFTYTAIGYGREIV